MKKTLLLVMVLALVILLVGCKEQEEDCLDSFCVDSPQYGFEGTISVSSIDRGTVEFQVSLTDEEKQLRSLEIVVYSTDWDFLMNTYDTEHIRINSSGNKTFKALDPSTDYIAALYGRIVVDGEFKDINIAYVEFTTGAFSPIDVSGSVDNIRVGSTFVLYDLELLSNDHYIVTYGVFLYKGENKIDEFTAWGTRSLSSVLEDNLVFSNLESNTTYTLKLSVIYELGVEQSNAYIDEVVFTTD